MGLALANGLVKSGLYKAEAITLTRRTLGGLEKYAEQGFKTTNNNAEAVKEADIIVLAVLPQQVNKVLDEIKPSVDPKTQLFTSLVSGLTCNNIKEKLYKDLEVVRVMPNTAISIQQSMTCFATDNASPESLATVKEIFDTVGVSIQIEESLMASATALCASGIAFFLRSIRAATQGGVEVGFHAHDALKMAAQTAKGAADLLLQMASHPEEEIDKVTSPKGCTIAGLNQMEQSGFSAAMVNGIKTAAKVAGGLYTKE